MRKEQRDAEPRRVLRLQPVLPVLFYTGQAAWTSPGRVADLVDEARTFAAVMPELKPVFVSLEAVSAGQLESEGGALGSVLDLVKSQWADPESFRVQLERTVQQLQQTSLEDH